MSSVNVTGSARHGVADGHLVRADATGDRLEHDIAVGQDSARLASVVDHEEADVSLAHEACCLDEVGMAADGDGATLADLSNIHVLALHDGTGERQPAGQ